jgi:alkanesulfonate monooxygenase SsuD/methylene tetrahydromethanopterin reductase-like flavin-dependent oxidoreductase (luciferase family)
VHLPAGQAAALWGEFASFANVQAHPRPIQRPTPPIVIGGGSWLAVRRAFTMGNGWYGFGLTLDQTQEFIEAFKQTAEQHERPAELGDLEITVTPIGRFDKRTVERYAEIGVHRLIVLPQPDATREQRHQPVPIDDILHNIEVVADTVIRNVAGDNGR